MIVLNMDTKNEIKDTRNEIKLQLKLQRQEKLNSFFGFYGCCLMPIVSFYINFVLHLLALLCSPPKAISSSTDTTTANSEITEEIIRIYHI